MGRGYQVVANPSCGEGPVNVGVIFFVRLRAWMCSGLAIRYADVAPWYGHVERFAGICGNKDNVPDIPDGDYLPPFEMNCVEQEMKRKISEKYKDRYMVHGRWAHLTKPNPIHLEQGRGQCQARDLCTRGCPYGGYFSSVSSTLPWAKKTGNLTFVALRCSLHHL
jgi:choline dehydrogenase-like flavoprotein